MCFELTDRDGAEAEGNLNSIEVVELGPLDNISPHSLDGVEEVGSNRGGSEG